MAGRWWHECPGPIDLTSLEAAIEDVYPDRGAGRTGPGGPATVYRPRLRTGSRARTTLRSSRTMSQQAGSSGVEGGSRWARRSTSRHGCLRATPRHRPALGGASQASHVPAGCARPRRCPRGRRPRPSCPGARAGRRSGRARAARTGRRSAGPGPRGSWRCRRAWRSKPGGSRGNPEVCVARSTNRIGRPDGCGAADGNAEVSGWSSATSPRMTASASSRAVTTLVTDPIWKLVASSGVPPSGPATPNPATCVVPSTATPMAAPTCRRARRSACSRGLVTVRLLPGAP